VAGPWDKVRQQQSSSVYGLPRAPTPQTPAQQQGDQLGVVRTQQQIQAQPLQNENTRVNIQQGQVGIQSQQQNTRFAQAKTGSDIGESFRNDPAVKAYREVIPQVAMAEQAAPGGPGDISVLYAWAKAMDPTGSVREGDVQLGQSATGPMQRAQFLISQYRLQDGGQLPPDVRVGLIEQMRNKAGQLNHQYSAVRQHYVQLAQQSGVPTDTIGEHEGTLYRGVEEQYIRSHGGNPRDPAAPQTQGQDNFNAPPPSHGKYQVRAPNGHIYEFDAPPDATPQQLDDLARKAAGFGKNYPIVENTINDVAGIAQGAAALPDAAATAAGKVLSVVPTAIGYGMDALGYDGSYMHGVAHDLANPYQIGDAIEHVAPTPDSTGGRVNRFVGQMVGGAVGMPAAAVEKTVARFVGDAPKQLTPNGPPPLVDPQTGELNQPMDAMKPAQRVQQMRNYGMKTVTPGMAGGRSARVIEQGFNNLPGSAGHMEDVNSAASGELRRSMQGVAEQFGSSKTLNEGGSAIQTAALARNERATGVIAKAYNAVPISDAAEAVKSSTIATLENLTGRFQSNPKLAEVLHDPKLSSYLDAFKSGNISWNDIKQFRSIIGEKIGEMRFGESSSTSDLRSLYAALSDDMRATAAQQGPRALRAFERANGLYRQNEQLIQNSLTRILGKDGQMTPERAAAAIQEMTKGGKAGGDLKTLAQIRSATIKSGAWDEIASTLIHLGGQPAKSEGRAFNPQTFVQWYADMSEPARAMLFKPELRKSLDGFVSMNQQLARIKGLSNTSNTTPTMIGSGLVAAGGVAAVTHPMALLGLVGGGLANFVHG
jgi:hypothetical protein